MVYCGGTWAGLISNLDYIQGMGFTAIWISPVPQNADGGYHGYWQQNMYEVNNNFGTAAELLALSNALHSRGMYLMVDIVTNHVGYNGCQDCVDYKQFTPFNDPSYYHPICDIDYNNATSIVMCWEGDNVVSMPDLRTETPEVVAEFSSWIKSMVGNYSIDGIRLDSGMEIDIDFYLPFQEAAGVYVMAEIDTGIPAQLCSFQEYTDGPLNYVSYFWINRAFGSTSYGFNEIAWGINMLQDECADTTLLGSFMENHDEPRFPNTQPDVVLAQNAIAFTILQDGIPIIYQGQEQHLSGGASPANREAIWLSGYNTQSTLYQWIKQINTIRNYVISKSADFVTYYNTAVYNTPELLVTRKGDNGAQVISIFTNVGAGSSNQSLELDSADTAFEPNQYIIDMVSCAVYQADACGNVTVSVNNGIPAVLYPAVNLHGSSICSQDAAKEIAMPTPAPENLFGTSTAVATSTQYVSSSSAVLTSSTVPTSSSAVSSSLAASVASISYNSSAVASASVSSSVVAAASASSTATTSSISAILSAFVGPASSTQSTNSTSSSMASGSTPAFSSSANMTSTTSTIQSASSMVASSISSSGGTTSAFVSSSSSASHSSMSATTASNLFVSPSNIVLPSSSAPLQAGFQSSTSSSSAAKATTSSFIASSASSSVVKAASTSVASVASSSSAAKVLTSSTVSPSSPSSIVKLAPSSIVAASSFSTLAKLSSSSAAVAVKPSSSSAAAAAQPSSSSISSAAKASSTSIAHTTSSSVHLNPVSTTIKPSTSTHATTTAKSSSTKPAKKVVKTKTKTPHHPHVHSSKQTSSSSAAVPALKLVSTTTTTSVNTHFVKIVPTSVPATSTKKLLAKRTQTSSACGACITAVGVTFEISTAPANSDETVQIVGSDSQLGNWNTGAGVSLNNGTAGWSKMIAFTPGAVIQYKYIVTNVEGSVNWEADPNHTFTVPTGCTSTAVVQDTWHTWPARV